MRIREKDIMWYIKSTCEIIMMVIFIICLIGFVSSFCVSLFYHMITNNTMKIAHIIMAWSICVGLFNFTILISCDKDWRRDYRDKEDAEEYD